MRIVLFAALMIVVGCASSRDIVFNTDATPVRASIEVNGVVMCNSTPCKIILRCSEQWVGLMNSPTGRAPTSGLYQIFATPLENPSAGRAYTSQKSVNPCQAMAGQEQNLLFRMDLEPIAPSQSIQIRP
jgi:hypothetical protein